MLTVGENFLRYKVLSLIGGGGMGDVYLAKDQQLERKVAIKVLRKKYSQHNDDAIERFMLEARSASALNHPNIITVYEIGESEGSRYIASEYIEGTTLQAEIDKNKLDLPEILNIAIQIAEALTAAHTAGIVHRDIKPENVMIREDRYVKVLDFGLAKLTESGRRPVDVDADTKKMMATDPGIIMGTVSYMSPEQTRGKNIDTRSDIWSLGVVIYEMLTGRRPFVGDTTSDLIAAILKTDPAEISVYAPKAPKALERIVHKALRKDREERYQHIKDLLIDLKDFRRELDSKRATESGEFSITDGRNAKKSTADMHPRAQTTAPMKAMTGSIRETIAKQFKLRPVKITALLGVILIALIFVGILVRNMIVPTGKPGSFESMRFTRLTSSANAEGGLISISRDRKFVVYAAKDQGKQSLWVRQTTSVGNVQIVSPGNIAYSGLTFSNDGSNIYYTASEQKEQSGIYTVPTLGGTGRKLIENASGPVAISPDGSAFAFTRNDRELVTANSDGSNPSVLATAGPGRAFWVPAWSPDGKTIAISIYSADDNKVRLIAVSVADGRQTPIGTQSWVRINGLAWLPDGSGLLFSGRDNETQKSQLWMITQSTGDLKRITNDPTNYIGLSLAEDGRTAVSIQENRLANIWTWDDGDVLPPKKITSEVGRDEGLSGIAIAPDGKIVYTTRIGATQDIWLIDPSDDSNRQLTFNVNSNFHPTVSPDGRFTVFVSDRTGNPDLWKMGIDGGNPVQLTNTVGIEGQPEVTPDGRWVVYQYLDEKRQVSISKIPIDGGDPIQLTNVGTSRPRISPDGKTFICNSGPKIVMFSVNGGPPLKVFELPDVAASPMFRWAKDGRSIVYINSASGFELWSQLLNGGPPGKILESGGDRIFNFDVSRNGKGFAIARGTETSDAVMIGNFR